MKPNFLKGLVFVLAVALFAAEPAQAQMTTGSVTGTVVDQTGAVVPGATVTLIDEATGATRETESNDVGAFVFDRVRVGTYTLRISKANFKTKEVRGMEVTQGRVAAVGNLQMEVGAATETVQVEIGTLPLVQAETPEITGNYDSRVVSEVNFGTFGLDSVAFLTAGIVQGFGNINTNVGSGGQFGESSAPAASGTRARSTQFNIDGHEINDISIGGPSIFISNQDTVAEYQVSVNNYDAATGRLPGAQINIITKSGTNELHGTAYYFYESAGTRSRTSAESRFFAPGDDKPKFVLQNYGGTVGGPLIKNKLFGFGSFQRARIPNSAAAQVQGTAFNIEQASAVALATALPNDATRLIRDFGPFSRLFGNPRCTPGTSRSFTTATTIPGSNPPTVINDSFGGVNVDACGITRDVFQKELFWEYSIRLDLQLKKQNFTGKWFQQEDDFCCNGGSAGYWNAIPFAAWSFSFGHSYQFSPRAINDFRFNAGRFFVAFEGGGVGTFGGSFLGGEAAVDSVRQNLANINYPTGFNDYGLAVNLPQGRLLYNFQFQDNFSYVWGKHTLKMGMQVRRNRTTAPFLPFINGRYNYTGSTSNVAFDNDGIVGGGPCEPVSLLDPDCGVFASYSAFRGQVTGDTVSSINFAEGPFAFQPFETDQFYYFQDDIRLRPNFILNVGIRYENTGQPVNTLFDEELARETGNFGVPVWNPAVPIEDRVHPKTPNDKNNWAPRIGFAYTPRWGKWAFGEDKTTIRGSYSIAYEAAFYNILLNMSTAAPRVFLFNPAITAAGIQGTGAGSALAVAAAPPLGTRDPREFSQSQVGFFGDKFYSPYIQTWTLGIQREFANKMVAEVRYVGNRNVGQFQSISLNPQFATFSTGDFPDGLTPCPAASAPATFVNLSASIGRVDCNHVAIRSRINGAWSKYHGLQARFDYRNLWNQLTGGTSFVWSKTIDNVSEIFGFFGQGSIAFSENAFETNQEERGLSNIHIGRVFTAYAIWDSPWRRDQVGVAGKILGGWELNGQLFIRDGRPWTPTTFFGLLAFAGNCGEDQAFIQTFAGLFETCRPYLGNPNAPIDTVGFVGDTEARWWVNDGSLGFHGVGRNPNIFGDGLVLTNLAIFKNTRFGKENRYNLQFRVHMQNVFNHRNFGVPDTFIDDSQFFGLLPDQASFARPNFNDAVGRLVRFGLRFVF